MAPEPTSLMDYSAFSQTLHAVDDLGIDDTGSSVVDADVESALSTDGTLIEFPNGTFLFEDVRVTGASQIGITNVEGESPTFITRHTDNVGANIAIGLSGSDLLFEGITFDYLNRSDDGGPAVELAQHFGDLYINDITFNGYLEREAFFTFVGSSDGVGLIENVEAKDGQISGKDRPGIRVGQTNHSGTLTIRDSQFWHFVQAGIFAEPPTDRDIGPVIVENCHFKNNNTANLRLGGSGSEVHDCTLIQNNDTEGKNETWTDPVPHFSSGTVIPRNIFFRDNSQSGDNIPVRRTKMVSDPYSSAAGYTLDGTVRVHTDYSGGVTLEECILEHNQADADAIDVNGTGDPVRIYGGSYYGTGSGSVDAAIDLQGHVGSEVRSSCISFTGDGQDGILIRDNSDYTVSETTINVPGIQIETTNSTGEEWNISSDGSCPTEFSEFAGDPKAVFSRVDGSIRKFTGGQGNWSTEWLTSVPSNLSSNNIWSMCIDDRNGYLYVAGDTANTGLPEIWKYDVDSGAQINSGPDVSTADRILQMGCNPHTGDVYVGRETSQELIAYNSSISEIWRTSTGISDDIFGVAYSDYHDSVFVGIITGEVHEYDPYTGDWIGGFYTNSNINVRNMAFDEEGWLYIASRGARTQGVYAVDETGTLQWSDSGVRVSDVAVGQNYLLSTHDNGTENTERYIRIYERHTGNVQATSPLLTGTVLDIDVSSYEIGWPVTFAGYTYEIQMDGSAGSYYSGSYATATHFNQYLIGEWPVDYTVDLSEDVTVSSVVLFADADFSVEETQDNEEEVEMTATSSFNVRESFNTPGSEYWTDKKLSEGVSNTIRLTTTADIPAGTSITATVYQDDEADGSGSETDELDNSYDNAATVSISDGVDQQVTLTGYDSDGSTDEWWIKFNLSGDGVDPTASSPTLDSWSLETETDIAIPLLAQGEGVGTGFARALGESEMAASGEAVGTGSAAVGLSRSLKGEGGGIGRGKGRLRKELERVVMVWFGDIDIPWLTDKDTSIDRDIVEKTFPDDPPQVYELNSNLESGTYTAVLNEEYHERGNTFEEQIDAVQSMTARPASELPFDYGGDTGHVLVEGVTVNIPPSENVRTAELSLRFLEKETYQPAVRASINPISDEFDTSNDSMYPIPDLVTNVQDSDGAINPWFSHQTADGRMDYYRYVDEELLRYELPVQHTDVERVAPVRLYQEGGGERVYSDKRIIGASDVSIENGLMRSEIFDTYTDMWWYDFDSDSYIYVGDVEMGTAEKGHAVVNTNDFVELEYTDGFNVSMLRGYPALRYNFDSTTEFVFNATNSITPDSIGIDHGYVVTDSNGTRMAIVRSSADGTLGDDGSSLYWNGLDNSEDYTAFFTIVPDGMGAENYCDFLFNTGTWRRTLAQK